VQPVTSEKCSHEQTLRRSLTWLTRVWARSPWFAQLNQMFFAQLDPGEVTVEQRGVGH
jgi:hypothetical protein